MQNHIAKQFFMMLLMLFLFAGITSANVFKVDDDGDPSLYYENLDTALYTASISGAGPHQIEIYAGAYTDVGLAVPANVDEIIAVETGVFFSDPVFQTGTFLDASACADLTVSGFTMTGYALGFKVHPVPAIPAQVFDLYDLAFDSCSMAIHGRQINNANMYDLTITNGGSNGILVEDNAGPSDDVTIGPNVVVTNMTGIGIYYHNSTDGTIDDCTVDSCGLSGIAVMCTNPGLAAAGTHNFGSVVSNCVVSNCWSNGIEVTFQMNANVTGNTVHDCATGTLPMSIFGGIALAGNGNIDSNTVYNNGDGTGAAPLAGGNDFGISVDDLGGALGSGTIRVRWNCLYGHLGLQGSDGVDLMAPSTSNLWKWNYYEGLAGTTYALDGTAGSVDNQPVKADNSVNDGGVGTYEVFDFVDFTVDWSVPPCDAGFTPLAAYNFSVTYDPAVLLYISGDYNYDFFGDSAFYGTIDDDTPGQLVFAAVDYVSPGVGDHELAFGQFQVVGIGNTSITISSTYDDVDNNPIITTNTPLDLTLEDNTFPSISVTTNNPVRDDIYSDGSPNVFSPDLPIELHIDGSALDQYMLKDLWWNADGSTWHLLATGIGADNFTFPTYYLDYTGDVGEGTHTLTVLVRDMADNRDSVMIPFEVDHTGPVLTSWSMVDPTCPITAGYTNNITNNVTFVDDGTADEVEFWSTGSWSTVLLDYATTTTFDISPAGDGLKSHYARLYDEFNNRGAHQNTTIFLDQTSVTPTLGWASDNSGDSYPGVTKTATRDVFADCNFDAATGTIEYLVSETWDTACGSAWLPMAPPVRPIPFELSAGDEVKTIYFFARDRAGNYSWTSTTIELDSAVSSFTSFGAFDRSTVNCTNHKKVRIEYTYDDTDLEFVGLSNTQGGPYTFFDLATYPDSVNWNLVNTEGLKTVYGVLKDDVGNLSAEASTEIFLDLVDPTAADLELNGGPSTWSQVSEVSVDFVTPSADITQIAMGEVTGVYTVTEDYTGSHTYDFGPTVTQNAWVYLYAQAYDCAGRDLVAEVDGRVAFDFVDPVLTAVEINGGVAFATDDEVDVGFTLVEASAKYVYLSEDAGMAGAVQVSYAGTFYVDAFTFSGEGDMTLYVQVEDYSGRLSLIESATIHVDITPPSAGTVTLKQTSNPWAADGYTNDEIIDIIDITYDDDVDSMFFSNDAATYDRVLAAGTYTPWTLTSGDGLKTVTYYFWDNAGNYGGPYTATITLDTAPITTPVVAPEGMPAGSVDLTWGAASASDYFYFLRYTYSEEYPEFESGAPVFPDIHAGFGGAEADPALAQIFGTSCTFTHPSLHTMFSFSIWTVDSAGNFDPATYESCSAVNYFAGDLDFDGVVEFVEDWGDFSVCYGLEDTDVPLWVDRGAAFCDIGPTDNGEYWGIPIPDQVIGYPDLTVFGQNFLFHGDHGGVIPAAKIGIPEPVEINIELPDRLAMNTSYTFPITVSNANSIFAYHLVFDYDNDMIEVVNVKIGDIHQDVRSFFYHDKKSSNLDLTGMVLADRFSGSEIAQVTIRAKNNTVIDFEELDINVRDMENKDISVTVNTVSKTGLIPESFVLKQNYPNPFNPTTTISMFLPKQGEYRLSIYNVTGQLVEEFNGFSDAGEVKIVWDASSNGSGVYFYKAAYGDVSAYKKMILLK